MAVSNFNSNPQEEEAGRGGSLLSFRLTWTTLRVSSRPAMPTKWIPVSKYTLSKRVSINTT